MVVLRGNRIGTDAAGTAALGKADGVQVAAGNGIEVGGSLSLGAQATDACDGACNLISGNGDGVVFEAGSGSIAGNHIGVN